MFCVRLFKKYKEYKGKTLRKPAAGSGVVYAKRPAWDEAGCGGGPLLCVEADGI